MALTITNAGSNNSFVSDGSLDVTGITADVGDWLVVMVACDNSQVSPTPGGPPTVGCSDTAGNTYTSRVNSTRDPGTTNEGVTICSFTAPVTTAISSGTVTVTFSPNTTAKTVLVKRIQPGVGESVAYVSTGTPANGVSTTPSSAAVSVTNGHTIMGIVGVEGNDTVTGDSDTTSGTWSAQQTAVVAASGISAIRISSQQKTVTATSTQTYNVTLGTTARDWIVNYMIFNATTNPTWGGLLSTTRNRLVQ